jgi:5-dehydro-4-deoxyglucarate dehydratase
LIYAEYHLDCIIGNLYSPAMTLPAGSVFRLHRTRSMTRMTPAEMASEVSRGLLSFPVTHFDRRGQFAEAPFRQHLAWLASHNPAGLFVAGGTGEFFSLSPDEVGRIASAAVAETAGGLPLIVGCGYGTAIAIDIAQRAEAAGADGLLLLPPYLVTSEADGLAEHVAAVCRATRLGVIVYNRDNAILDDVTLARLADRCPNLVGFKDGVGDIELMVRVQSRLEGRLMFIGGLPTAETFALPYLDLGVTTYSSAIFNFVPEFAQGFYQAVRARDHAMVMAGLRDFVLPYVAIRNRRKGYPVSIVKAGLRAVGRDAGPVRAPLVDLSEQDQSDLAALIERCLKPQDRNSRLVPA